jgi:hypothetical protein
MDDTLTTLVFNPVAMDFRRALLALRDTTRSTTWGVWVGLLKTQYRMADHRVTSAQLAEVMGYRAFKSGNSNCRQTGKVIAAIQVH